MKKTVVITLILLVIAMLLSACVNTTSEHLDADDYIQSEAAGTSDSEITVDSDSSGNIPESTQAVTERDAAADAAIAESRTLEEELCDCGINYARDVFNMRGSPPFEISTGDEDGFLDGFNTIHSFSYSDYDAQWYQRIIIWTDTPVRDLTFITLDYDFLGRRNYFYTREALFTIDEFLPGDAFVLDVAFSVYQIPQGGLSFIGENGERQFISLHENMAGECFCAQLFFMRQFDDRTAVLPENRINSIYPTAEQHEIISGLLGDYELGEIYEFINHGHIYDATKIVQLRLLHFDGRETFYLTGEQDPDMPWRNQVAAASDMGMELIAQSRISPDFYNPFDFETEAGDVILVHFGFFNDTLLMIDIGESSLGYSEYVLVELG